MPCSAARGRKAVLAKRTSCPCAGSPALADVLFFLSLTGGATNAHVEASQAKTVGAKGAGVVEPGNGYCNQGGVKG